MIGAGALLAVLASIGYGVSDVVSGTVVRRHATASLALWAQVTGLAVLGVVAAVRRPEMTLAGSCWGAGAGAVGALAVLAFYTALQRGRTSVVAPVAGAGVAIPVLAGLASGDAIGWRAGAGVLAAVAGVLIVAAASGDDGRSDPAPGDDQVPRAVAAHRRPTPGRTQPVPAYDGCVPRNNPRSARSAVWLAAAAATGFGLFFVLLEHATQRAAVPGDRQSGLDTALAVSLAVQVGALVVTLLAATRHTRACLRPDRALAIPATGIGLLDVGADLLLTVAVDRGPLSIVGPLGSLDPVVSVLIATVLLGERLKPVQTLGVLAAIGGIVLTATG